MACMHIEYKLAWNVIAAVNAIHFSNANMFN